MDRRRAAPPSESFPRRSARTRRFGLGEPRTFGVASGRRTVLFLRSRSGTDPSTALWEVDATTGAERLVADPATLTGAGPAAATAEELRRRERLRESAEGITSYAGDAALERVAVALGGAVHLVDVLGGGSRVLPTAAGAFDPRPDPTGRRVAYVAAGALRVVELADGRRRRTDRDRLLVGPDGPGVTWGLAEFVAAEEMGRQRGFWWSPDGTRLAVARVDETPVQVWHLADPAHSDRPPTAHRYPQAGTANADVRLAVVDLAGNRVPVRWDRRRFPYLVDVWWQADRPLTIAVQTRDQREVRVLTVDAVRGTTRVVDSRTDRRWVELVPGLPRWHGDALVSTVDRGDTRRLAVDGRPVTPAGLQVRGFVGTLGEALVVAASADPTVVDLYRVAPDGSGVRRLTDGTGVCGGVAAGDVVVRIRRSLRWAGARVDVRVGHAPAVPVRSVAADPGLVPAPTFHVVGDRRLRSVVLLPRGRRFRPPFPVLCDPYGGPHALRVVRSRNDLLTSQWFADQGFAVVVTDGRGTPARGPAWERAVWGDLAGPVLDDQVDALEALFRSDDRLDRTRVGIRGWSFGGYLAALAVLRRPDVFHAAVAGAPVTDWRLYDTHYTERYLGLPGERPAHYRRTSLLEDAARLERPLLLVHGLVDDNVVVAHTLQMSSALLAAGRPHTVLPLSGVTHMTPQEVVAENLLRLQVAFLRSALSGTSAPAS